MNLRIWRLSVVLSVLYLVLFLQLNRVQFFGAERLQDDVNNTRGLIREFGRARGPIITADGVLVAPCRNASLPRKTQSRIHTKKQ